MDVDRTIEGLQLLALDEIHQSLAVQHAADVVGERHEKIKLMTREDSLLAIDPYRARATVNLEPAEAKRRVVGMSRAASAPKNCPDAGQKLAD